MNQRVLMGRKREYFAFHGKFSPLAAGEGAWRCPEWDFSDWDFSEQGNTFPCVFYLLQTCLTCVSLGKNSLAEAGTWEDWFSWWNSLSGTFTDSQKVQPWAGNPDFWWGSRQRLSLFASWALQAEFHQVLGAFCSFSVSGWVSQGGLGLCLFGRLFLNK